MNTKKTVTIKFNSTYAITNTNNQTTTYYIDWSAYLKNDQSYKLTWTYCGMRNTFGVATKLALLFINIYGDNYSVNGSDTNVSFNIGCLNAVNVSLFADLTFNPPIYLKSRPTNNEIKIEILTSDNPPLPWTDGTNGPNNYMLTLNFTEL